MLVDIGGFLGIGAKQVAVPISELSQQGDQITIALIEEGLETASSYTREGENWCAT